MTARCPSCGFTDHDEAPRTCRERDFHPEVHVCTDSPNGCWRCEVASNEDMRAPRTFVLGGTWAEARRWCRNNGVKVYARSTVFARHAGAVRGYIARPGDRVVTLGAGLLPEPPAPPQEWIPTWPPE